MRLGTLLVVCVMATAACSGTSSGRTNPDLADLIASAEPGARIEVAAGRHAGPIVIDKPITLVGQNGAVIVGSSDQPGISIVDTTAVMLVNLTAAGGDSGILVTRSTGVVLDRITVQNALWHGILAQDSEVKITGCRISDLRAPYPQGVEIVNSDGRPPSLVEGCTIEGPIIEGIVTHVSRATIIDNEVRGSTERGIAITEMSAGRIEGNRVLDAIGSAFYCGDMSRCSVVDNVADRVASADVGFRSTDGHGLVIHFHSIAFVDDLRVTDVTGDDIVVMLDSNLSPVSVYP